MKVIKSVVAPLAAAVIWGFAFSAQSVGAEHVEAFTFTAARGAVAVVTLSVLLIAATLLRRGRGVSRGTQDESSDNGGESASAGGKKSSRRALLVGGLCCGTVLCVATNLQQLGLGGTDSGKASFITALYIVLVPIFGLFFHRRVSPITAASVAVAVVGMYLLCVGEGFSMQASDIYVIICAFCFAIHIMVIDHFAPHTDGIALSLVQFAVMTVESAICMLIFETPQWSALMSCLPQVLYVGVLSSGVAYTLQIIAQQASDPTMVSLLLSLESVFGALGGALFLHETMTAREYVGCGLMLCAVIAVTCFAQRGDDVLHTSAPTEK